MQRPKKSLQELVLRDIRLKGPDCRANEILERVIITYGKSISFGTIFTTLDRLVNEGFLEFKKGSPEARRGGRAPRLYTITGLGVRALNEITTFNYNSHIEHMGEVAETDAISRGKP